ncbi:hypothetical protein PLEOSDRAFT_1104716 [Pleurotus ostreatus PC15]|uniref:Non-structural maintenance of chromosomes element 4 n=1 Tax=Pleurotus ostreatus (strain PC15) TaxID=1137138 RepID=A0A067NJ26_PLEO1|nr:hypothetical protein PLEOSDRAFT_1104716 [Pleurotus ostreatus PC15]
MPEDINQGMSDLAFDPDQNPEEKRAVRRQYRSLARDLEDKRDDNQCTPDHLISKVQDSDGLFMNVKGPQEATLDSAFLLMASNIGAQKARAMKSGTGTFDVDEFITKLLSFMGGAQQMEDQLPEDSDDEQVDSADAPLNWEKIGRKALAQSRRVPVMDFMLGPLTIEQKKRNVVKRAKLEKNKEDLKRPQELKEEDISRSPNETTKNVAILQKLLNDNPDPINLFKFIINPNDFAQSVENIFYLSFLIRDGHVAFEIQDGEPIIYPCEPPTDEDRMGGGLRKRQLVTQFDMATWRRAIEVFNITETKIPQRPPAQTRLGDKWYG